MGTPARLTAAAQPAKPHAALADVPKTVAQWLAWMYALGLDRLDAQLLLLHALGRPETERAWLLAHDTDPLPCAAGESLRALALRRVEGEPLAYITGQKEFFGLLLAVDARVLVPRPDTETLVEWALDALPSQPAPPTDRQIHAIDLGTGSGAIALALKATRPQWDVTALDFSTDALAVARANATRLSLDIRFRQGAWLEGISERFDLIVSNPPYIAANDRHLAALTHEPLQALASGTDGLHDIRSIVTQSVGRLQPGGWLLLEHGYDQAAAVCLLLREADFENVQSRNDLAGIARCSGGRWGLI